jgi:mycothiol synthase
MNREVATPVRVELRPFDPAVDYEPIAELTTTTNVADGVDWALTSASIQAEVAPGGYWDPERDCRVALVDGERVGFIRVSSKVRDGERVIHRFDVWTRPEWRRRGVGRTLLAWAEERSRAMRVAGSIGEPGMPHFMSGGVNMAQPEVAAAAEALGYERIRYSFLMRRPLEVPIDDAPLPDGLEFRSVREADHRAIFDGNEEAFEDHWEHAERTEDDFRILFAEPALDTSLWAVAWDGDQVAGVSMNWIDAEENAQLGTNAGWLGSVSVRRPWRKRGVGAAVITASLRTFKERGMDDARLGVDAENPTGALALYTRLGFTPYQTFGIYRKQV